MKIRFTSCIGLSLALVFASSSPAFTQSQQEDTSAILNLVRRGYGPVNSVVIIDNYATLDYLLGQNSGIVTLKRQNGRWKIIDGRPRKFDYCGEVSCLVKKGVPRQIANQLFTKLSASRRKQSNELKSFQQAWSKIHSSAIPFLGYWENGTFPIPSSVLTVSILPSYTPNKVCVVGITENSQYVEIGTVFGKTINTENDKLSFVKGLSGVYDTITSQKRELDLASIAPPNNWYFSAETKNKLQQAGCTTSLPNRR
ncbi:hypothetical protein GTQ43_03640 [Nostoc sp. KVJ3]|uniref:hypothetical protein n=1 Tax=Nostoc sp. KVJ3 TaxID=457945 RepID=UPI0022387E40|nr:hypothetical protein [Nostoc sp. KVJ3]MCW5312974.1 hypothetical protein [Nostoc sp. KVJ3]